jgi:phosphoglycolate phosphatase
VKLVLFDIDGTLITSRGAGRHAMRSAFEHVFGTAGGIDTYDLRGRTDTRIVHDVMVAEGWDATRVRERLDDFFEAYLRGLVTEIGDGQGVVTLPGVAPLVEELARSSEVVLGLVTGNIEEGARIKLLPTGLWPSFRVGAYGSDHMDRRRLPSLAARRAHALLGREFPPADLVVIGDTPHDVDCARACGAVAVAVATGQYPREALLADGPTTSSRI